MVFPKKIAEQKKDVFGEKEEGNKISRRKRIVFKENDGISLTFSLMRMKGQRAFNFSNMPEVHNRHPIHFHFSVINSRRHTVTDQNTDSFP